MKSRWLILLGLAVALRAGPADAAAKSRKHLPDRSAHAPVETSSSYYEPYLTDASGNRVPIIQIPGSATVVPRQVIEDQQDITLCGALRNVSGVFCR